jgi:hypothetical protein
MVISKVVAAKPLWSNGVGCMMAPEPHYNTFLNGTRLLAAQHIANHFND